MPTIRPALLTLSLVLLASQNAQAKSAGDAMPSENSPTECTALLNDAEAALERGRRLAGLKRWSDAKLAYKDAVGLADNLKEKCPAEAGNNRAMIDAAIAEFRSAENSSRHQSDCQPNLDKALDLDIKASTAKRDGRDAAEIERFLGDAEKHWRQAVESCQSPHKEKAERSLNTTLRTRATNAELLSNSPACDSAWKNAGLLGELAKAAWKDKQWEDASALYSKSAMAWEVAAEKCTGSRQQQAEKKVEQSQVDSHNAEYCGPQWDTANQLSQQLKTSGASAGLNERDQMSILAEIAWRQAVNACQGSPQGMARNNADALARERGAPLPPSALAQIGKPIAPAATTQTEQRAASAPAAAPASKGTVTAKTAPQPATTATPLADASKPAAVATVATGGSSTAAANKPTDPEEIDIMVGDTAVKGKFVVDRKSGLQTGTGKVTWSNGDVYVGSILDGKRHGKGKFSWASGQWYEGDWQDDMALGQGAVGYTNGNYYEGQVKNGTPHGRGSFRFPNGDRYTGDFVEGLFHGQGTYFWKGGSRYDGAWVLGLKQGQGKLTQTSGDGWEGLFKDDQETDDGKRFTAPGKIAENSQTAESLAANKPQTTPLRRGKAK